MDSRIVATSGFVFALVFSSCVAAQDITTPSPILKGAPAALPAAGNGSWSASQIQDRGWNNSSPIPGSPDRFPAPTHVRLNLRPASSTEALRRIPFYVTAPYWLPRSRGLGNANNGITAQQPNATHGALLNDIATLVHSAASD